MMIWTNGLQMRAKIQLEKSTTWHEIERQSERKRGEKVKSAHVFHETDSGQ